MASESRKRKRDNKNRNDALEHAYQGVAQIVPREKSSLHKHAPGTPLSFFQSSYTVKFDVRNREEERKDEKLGGDSDRALSPSTTRAVPVQLNPTVVVHQHPNGLCIVTLGDSVTAILRRSTIRHVEFLVEAAPDMSAGERRKRQSKMVRGKQTVDHVVAPSTPLVRLVVDDHKNDVSDTVTKNTSVISECSSREVIVHAGVWGTVLELNRVVTPELLQKDPLLDGYLAVILPSGAFPPRHLLSDETTDTNIDENEPIRSGD